MKSLSEKFEEYLNSTPREEIMKAWNSTSKYAIENSPSFSDMCERIELIQEKISPPQNQNEIVFENIKNPYFETDFFLTYN